MKLEYDGEVKDGLPHGQGTFNIYGDLLFSNLNKYGHSALIYKSINFINYDRTLSHSEYDLFATNFSSYGVEFDLLYKKSTTFRFLINHIESIYSDYAPDFLNVKKSNIINFGIGFRVKSILGPINFMWTHANKDIHESINNDKYFFSMGVNIN